MKGRQRVSMSVAMVGIVALAVTDTLGLTAQVQAKTLAALAGGLIPIVCVGELLAEQCGLQPGEFVWTGGDCHLYSNHLDQARLQLTRTPKALPRLVIKRRPDSIDQYEYADFAIEGYEADAHIPAPVAV